MRADTLDHAQARRTQLALNLYERTAVFDGLDGARLNLYERMAAFNFKDTAPLDL